MAPTEHQAVHINVVLPDGRETAIAFGLPSALNEVVFVVGRLSGGMSILGVFSERGLAEQACTTADDFVGPWPLNHGDTDDDVHPWAGQYFPRRGEHGTAA